jgi:SsrA-binding protein
VSKERGRNAIATNRKARHLYNILETVEAGVALVGNEVKSLRLGRSSLLDAFAVIESNEVEMYNLHIAR